MNLFYDSGYFQVILGEERPGFEKVSGSMAGYDITAQKVMDMLTKAQGDAKQSGGNLQSALAYLEICHRVKSFKKPGQEETNFSKYIWYYILFGKKKATFNTVSNFIKTMPKYSNYRIIPYVAPEKETVRKKEDDIINEALLSTANWHVSKIDDEYKKVTLKEYPNTIVVDSYDFKIRHSDFPEFNGDLLPALEEIMTPIQFSPILPAQREEFFGKNL